MPFPLTVYKASAGSGKTFTLATEFIKLLVLNPQNYKQILAVTFTNKATEEMKTRILSQLYGIWQGLEDSRSYARKVSEALKGQLSDEQIAERAGQALHLLLHNYSYFRVETIDSFFQSIMRNLARELNLAANLRVGLNDAQVEEMAVDQLIDSLTASDRVLQWLMKYIMDNISDDRSWNVIGQIKKFGRTIFRDFYKNHSQELTALMQKEGFFDSYQKELLDIRHQASERMKEMGRQFFEAIEAEGLTIEDLSYGKTGVASLFLKLQNGIFDESVISKRATDCLGRPDKWYKKTHPRRELIHHLADTVLDGLLRTAIDEQPRQWKRYKSADLTLRHLFQLRLLGTIEQKMRQLNEEQNRFLLSDTQQLLHELIGDSDTPFIFEKTGTQLKHIMIDEFQDTSTVQWQNFKILLQEAMSHKGSENLIVGDVKQSIYRWRSGDWRLLAGIKEQFADADKMVNIETLSTNYRSARRIVSFNNAFFTEAARQEEVGAYDDVVQTVPAQKGDEGLVKVMLLPAEDYEQQTLEVLTSQIAQLLEEGVPVSDMAILVRANNYIPLIASHVMEHLPEVKVVSDEAFRLDASPAVVSIVTALRLLTHPDDAIARAYLTENGELRTESTENGELRTERYDYSQGGEPSTSKTNHTSQFSVLSSQFSVLRSQLLQPPLYELTEQLYAILHLDRMAGQSAYLCAFYDQVASFVADNGSDVNAFLREWDESIGAKTIQSSENEGLRLISIHKAKGLEYPCVLIPFCDWQLEQADVLWCSPREEPFSQLPLAPIDYSQKGMKGTIYDRDYEEEHRQNIVDNLNLLYVAFTRASQQLFVYGKRKASALSRSALIERVLSEIVKEMEGATLQGMEDESQPLCFVTPLSTPERGENSSSLKRTEEALPPSGEPRGGANPFLWKSIPVKVPIEALPSKADFKQSNKSRQFAVLEDDEQAQQQEYIQMGNVLHYVLSTIRTTDDIDAMLGQLEQEGIIAENGEQRAALLRQRLADPRVAEWFRPGRWKLYNECSILCFDTTSGRVVERRPDRVMTDGTQTIVVDFKFGREREEYLEQVRQYMALLAKMGHRQVKGYLWFVYNSKIVEVKI
jgi:ATP-dependent exoDNAse (exonuclease V) beta subunit